MNITRRRFLSCASAMGAAVALSRLPIRWPARALLRAADFRVECLERFGEDYHVMAVLPARSVVKTETGWDVRAETMRDRNVRVDAFRLRRGQQFFAIKPAPSGPIWVTDKDTLAVTYNLTPQQA